jgi:hypothetical protein
MQAEGAAWGARMTKGLALLLFLLPLMGGTSAAPKQKKKTVYMSYILHGNMNYDRYTKSTIWRDFPVIYDYLLDFMEEHPDFKGQVEFSGQTVNSLKQTAPHVIEHAMKLHRRGQVNFTGAFYSAALNVTMDGETNWRCAALGVNVLKDVVGAVDGFFVQERAFHAQMPWILNRAGVNWAPVTTGDDVYFPFKLKGMDGSTIGIPVIDRSDLLGKIKNAPDKGIILIEEDYEIPQAFSHVYREVSAFDEQEKDLDVVWITLDEYIRKFGVNAERYADSAVRAGNRDNGAYSRWTADPLDIIIQEHANRAMSDFRAATLMNALVQARYGKKIDEPFEQAKITLEEDPVTWDIEHAATYPDVEPKFLTRDGEITILTKADHLLLWAVNSDARGWYPLYERRRERINSFNNSSNLSNEIINRGLDALAQQIKTEGYDRYYILFNAEAARTQTLQLETTFACDVFDDASGKQLRSTTLSHGGAYMTDVEADLPAYGYKVVGLKKSANSNRYPWAPGNSVRNGALSVSVENDKIYVARGNERIELSLDEFQLKALADMHYGAGDAVWRRATPHGQPRVTVKNALYPQLRIESQIDWLIHLQQTFTLLPDRILCDMCFDFPHPTVIRKDGGVGAGLSFDFDPRGLTVQVKTGKAGQIWYDIPFGMSPHTLLTGMSYFCAWSAAILQYADKGGWMMTTGTGEQGFYTIPDKGEFGLYIGASTTSGPVRNMGMTFVDKTHVEADLDWYGEPFHGIYDHRFMLYPYTGTWEDSRLPEVAKSYTQPVYLREIAPNAAGALSPQQSLLTVNRPGIEVTAMDYSAKDGATVRLNNKSGKDATVRLTIGEKAADVKIPANAIIETKIK